MFFFLLFIAVVLLYANVINGQFLSADDIPGIVDNPLVRDFNASVNTLELEKILPAVMFKAFGMTPAPYHITSIFMHYINVILAFVLLFLLFGKTPAIVGTLVFMLHPLNSEAVAWISAYGYLFYTAFALVILINFVMWHKTKYKIYLVLTLTVYTFCLIFYRKPWVALIPVFVVLIDQFILETKLNYRKIIIYTLFAIPTLIYMFTYVKQTYAFRTEALVNLYYNDPKKATPYFNRVLYTTYMTEKLMLWPIGLTIYHEGEKVPTVEFFTAVSAIGTLLVIGLVIWLLAKGKKNPVNRNLAGLVLLIYAAILLSYYPVVVVWAMADRYLYISTLFFGAIIGILYSQSRYKKAFGYFLVALLLFYGVRTVIRTNDWKSSKNLWFATQKVSPYSYRVYNNLGDVYSAEQNYEMAIKNFQTSLMLSPTFADAVHNLGFTYYQIGERELAKEYLLKAYEMNPYLYQALHKLGVMAYEDGDIELAKQFFLKALEINPGFQPVINNLLYLENLPPSTAPKKLN
jgi:protein O-mannosyl-transferase